MSTDKLAASAGTITIGDLTVNRIGLGTNRITDTPTARDLLKKALELGINFIDTAHRYADGASETTIGATLAPYAPGLVVATKGGLEPGGPAASPAQLRSDLEDSLRRLKTDCIDLYQLHRVDPRVPLQESLEALKDFQTEGKIRCIGLSEVTVDQIDKARAFVDIVSVQNQYNIVTRTHEAVVDYCTSHNLAFIPWFPLGGLRGDAAKVNDLLANLTHKYQASSQQLALAWLLKRSPVILPIPGTLSIDHLINNLESATVDLSDDDFAALTQAV